MTELPRLGLPPALRIRLRRMATIVRILILIGAVSVVAANVWIWVLAGHAASHIKDAASVDIGALALRTRVAGGLWSLLPSGIVLLGLLRLWQLFDEYALGRVFSQRALVSLRGFARCILAIGFVAPLYGAVLLAIVGVMAEAARVAEDNAGFV